MASTPIPPSLDRIGDHPFAFYPPIRNESHNEWKLRKTTWSEILVANSQTGAEIWIPKRYLGEVSTTADPILIVGLNRELELKAGMLVTHQRRVIRMPEAIGGSAATSTTAPGQGEPAHFGGIRLEASDRRVFKLVGFALVASITAYLLFVNSARLSNLADLRQTVSFTGSDQSFANLNSRDDYLAISQKLGTPVTDRQVEVGTILYRALGYPERKYTVILMGPDKSSLVYIGTVDQDWRPIHSVSARTQSLLRELKRF
jgi:hypothetical protein